MRKILITTSSFNTENNSVLRKLTDHGFSIVLNPYGRRLSEYEVRDLLSDGEIVGMIAGVETISDAVMKRAPGLKVISRCGIGMDSVDLNAAKTRGIQVMNTPGAPVAAVAEITIGLILNLLRQIVQADREMRLGQWKQRMGKLLAFQTVGIIGCGRIGRRVAELLHAHGARILAYDPIVDTVPCYVELCAFDSLLERADIVTLHLPYAESSHHIIGAKEMAKMKVGAYLINAARGGLVDEAALFSTLNEGHLAGAALDTFENEPYSGKLKELPQVILTAHMGSYAKESRIQMENEAAENLWQGLVASGFVTA